MRETYLWIHVQGRECAGRDYHTLEPLQHRPVTHKNKQLKKQFLQITSLKDPDPKFLSLSDPDP
jgi:hypothetical protein